MRLELPMSGGCSSSSLLLTCRWPLLSLAGSWHAVILDTSKFTYNIIISSHLKINIKTIPGLETQRLSSPCGYLLLTDEMREGGVESME